MRTHEFAYWLQGYFELQENTNALTRKQAECIVRHAQLVTTVERTRTGNFVSWVRGVLQTAGMIDNEESNGAKFEDFSASLTELIRAELHECFKHEIDNKYGVEGLGEVHKPLGPPTWDPNTLIRC